MPAFLSTSAVGNREELSGIVDLTQRSDTPIYSMIGNDKASSTNPNWETVSMDAPGDNAQAEGRDYSFTPIDPAVRVGNHVQIMEKQGSSSGTQEAVANAGKAEQLSEDKIRSGVALRTDVEYSLVAPNASVGGTTRRSGGLPTWAETNVKRGATGANGGFNSGTGLTVAPTDGTKRDFTKLLLDDLLQEAYQSGAKLEHCFVSPYNKRVFATFMSDANVAQFRYDAKGGKNTVVADAEVYMGPLGTVFVHPNFVMGAAEQTARNVLVLDTKKIKYSWLRKIKEDKDLAKTGDYKKFMLQGEGCVKPLNEKAVGVIADVFGINATT